MAVSAPERKAAADSAVTRNQTSMASKASPDR